MGMKSGTAQFDNVEFIEGSTRTLSDSFSETLRPEWRTESGLWRLDNLLGRYVTRSDEFRLGSVLLVAKAEINAHLNISFDTNAASGSLELTNGDALLFPDRGDAKLYP